MTGGASQSTALEFNDIPRYSEWPKRLLSLTPFGVKYKTEKEVLREYQDEKWAELLRYARTLERPTLAEIERHHVDFDALSPGFDDGVFVLANEQAMLDKHLALYAGVLKPHLEGASCLVELGAGFGSKLLGLAHMEGFADIPLGACEFTQNGRELIALLAAASNRPTAVGHCDFRAMTIDAAVVPENAVIFTSYAVHYVPQLAQGFIDFLLKLRPKAVVHFEPCYEHHDTDTLHGLMCRRYIELNDYVRNFATLVAEAAADQKILVRTRKNVLGSNPFLPISVIEWNPPSPSRMPA